MPTGAEIMTLSAGLLTDRLHTRWPLADLCSYINEGVKAIILAKPSANTSSIIMQLERGTLQHVPNNGPLMLIRIERNLKTTAPSPRIGGRVVTVTSKSALDAANPWWHDEDRVPYKKEVRQFVFDEANPLEYYVYPGNDGTGIIEGVVSSLPAPLVATGDVTLIGSYNGSVGLPEPYSVPLQHYVCYMAQSKDDLTGNAGKAGAYYQMFAQAVGLKVQVERAHSPRAAV